MSSNIFLKKSSQAGKIPLNSDLSYGELALNYTDGKLYYKTSSNEIRHFISTVTTATLFIDNVTNSTTTNRGALVVSGGVAVGGNVYVGNRMGFVSTSNSSVVYQVYNPVTNSLDTVFG